MENEKNTVENNTKKIACLEVSTVKCTWSLHRKAQNITGKN